MIKTGLLDMDGTLFNYSEQLYKDLSLLQSPEEGILPIDYDENLPHLKARMRLIKRNRQWWIDLPKFQLGWDVYNMALEIGFDIEILTKGPWGNSEGWAGKHECIAKHFGPDATINIVGKSKKGYYGRFLCDDWTEYAQDWLEHRPRGLVVMPVHDYNKGFKHPNVIPYDGTNKKEVFSVLEAVFKRQTGEHWKEHL